MNTVTSTLNHVCTCAHGYSRTHTGTHRHADAHRHVYTWKQSRRTQTHAQDVYTAGTRMRVRTRTRTRVCTCTDAPRAGASGCASLCTVLAAARPAQGPACASASARRCTHGPAGLHSDQASDPGAGQGAQRSVLGPAGTAPQGWLDMSRAAPLPGQLLLKASGPAPTENERRWGAPQERGGGKSGGQCRGEGTGPRGLHCPRAVPSPLATS